jgi:hypothetical protein
MRTNVWIGVVAFVVVLAALVWVRFFALPPHSTPWF